MNEYETPKGMAAELRCCERTVRNRLKEMQPLVGTKYHRNALITDGRKTWVRSADYLDFINHRKDPEAWQA